MKKQIEKIRQRIAEEPTESGTQKKPLDIAMERVLHRLLRYLVPVCLIAVVINLTIMFTAPVEVTVSRWFWLKEPISIGAACLICKLFKPLCRHVA